MKEPVEFYESYGYISEPLWESLYFRIFVYSFIFIFISLVVLFLYRYLKNRKEKMLTAWDWAILRLNKIDINKYKTKQDFKQFYFEITEIVKKYFYKRYYWHVLDKTDQELIQFLESKKFDKDLLETLIFIFNNALFIKFAGQEAFKPQAEKDLKFIYELIQKTKIVLTN
jgi:hypothetical protein